jgi:hypothetical protein
MGDVLHICIFCLRSWVDHTGALHANVGNGDDRKYSNNPNQARSSLKFEIDIRRDNHIILVDNV